MGGSRAPNGSDEGLISLKEAVFFIGFKVLDGEDPDALVGEPKGHKWDVLAPNNGVDFGVLFEFEAPNKEAGSFVGLGAPNGEPPNGGAEEPNNEEDAVDPNPEIVFVVFAELDVSNRELPKPVEEDVVAPVPKSPLLLVVAGVVPLVTVARPKAPSVVKPLPNKPSARCGVDTP
jgi:hypothetical protein